MDFTDMIVHYQLQHAIVVVRENTDTRNHNFYFHYIYASKHTSLQYTNLHGLEPFTF